jgi:murein DD-endopeptidase MepM/ murein hydrolase activator NlpD
MARVPVAENLVRQQPVTDAKFRTFDAGADMVGEGVARLGRGIGEFAEGQAKVQELRAEEEASRLDTEHMDVARELRAKVRSAQGINARAATEEARRELEKLNRSLEGKASTPLARRMLRDTIQKRTSQELDTYSIHSVTQENKAVEASYKARSNSFAEDAIDNSEDLVVFNENIAAGVADLEKQAAWAGWDADRTKTAKADFTSRIYTGKARLRFMADDPQGALAVLDAHRDKINAAEDAALRSIIKPQLDNLQADSDVALLLSGVKADALPDVPPGESTFQSPIRTDTVTVPGGRYGAPRPYGAHVGLDQAGVKPGTPVYPMAGGTIGEVTRTQGGGNTVVVNMAGGWTMKVLHLADGSTSHLRPGQPVDVNDIIGGVGNTGTASKGTHLHTEVYDPSGKRVDPSKLFGRAAPRTPAPDGTRVNLADGYAKIDKMPWTDARKQRARERLRGFAAENDTVLLRSEQDADRAVSTALLEIERGGGKLTNMTQMDAAVVARASPEYQRQLLSMIEQNTRPKPVDANGTAALSLTLLSSYDPEKFKTTDLRLYQHQLTPAEFMQIAKDQAEMRTKPPGASPVANLRAEIDSTIRFYAPDIGLKVGDKASDKDRKQYLQIFDRMRSQVARITDGKREPTDEEMKAAFDQATMKVIVKGGGALGITDADRRLYEVEQGDRYTVKVPNDVLGRIVQSYQRVNGRQPSQAEAVQVYLQNKGRPGFWD